MSARTDLKPRTAGPTHTLRIIAGQWRGTRLHFPAVAAIRPTPDRVRETVFNWLQHELIDARVLDLFAGSGALGLEALSRGAATATFVDIHPAITRYLRDTLTRLRCQTAQVAQADGQAFLSASTASWDGVFLDPPFVLFQQHDWVQQLFTALQQPGRLGARAWIYLECPATLGTPAQWTHWPAHWQLQRSKQAGQVGYHLARLA